MNTKVMRTIGRVLAIVLAVFGLVGVGFLILLAVAFESYGSNK